MKPDAPSPSLKTGEHLTFHMTFSGSIPEKTLPPGEGRE